MIVLFAAAGVLLAALAFPLAQRRIKPNGWYGLRVEATFADESVWYDANAASGRDLLVLGVIQTVTALLFPLWPGITPPAYAIANLAILVGGVIVMAVFGIRRANRLLAERRRPGG